MPCYELVLYVQPILACTLTLLDFARFTLLLARDEDKSASSAGSNIRGAAVDFPLEDVFDFDFAFAEGMSFSPSEVGGVVEERF